MDALTHGKEHHRRRAHRISLGVPNTIFYWLPLYRGTQSSIFSLSLSLSHPAIFIWRFHFPLPLYPRKGSPSVSRSLPPPLSTLCKTAPEFSSVSDSTSFHHFFFHFSVHTLSARTSVAPAATACRVECRPDSNRVHYL